jgi:arylsulfatase A-like enzyme/tetratricopeptide (TPR) repeat protein
MTRRGLSILAVPAVLVALSTSACNRTGPGATPAAPARLPDGTPVVFISVDTLRADHLPAYGYRGVETPALDALRRDAVLFENAYTTTPLTFPAHSSLLTGLLPAGHGVRDNVGYSLDPARIQNGELPYLPEILKKEGYATGGAVSAYVLRGKTGLSTGFDFYEDSIEFRTDRGLGGLQRPGTETLRLTREWLATVSGKPFFLFFHLYEPHTPYTPPEPFASRYASKYDGEIAASDQIVGGLLDELRRLGVYDKALIVLLSDHGEGLGDHGEEEHGVLLYREAIHIPLFLKLPGGALAGQSVAKPAGITDVAPTVLALLGLDVPKTLPGVSLASLTDARAPVRRMYSETFYPRLHFGWNDLASLADDRHHYIEGPDPELYDLQADPGEKRNVLAEQRRVFAALRQEMAGFDRQLAPPGEVDPETRQAMISLGYIGSAAGKAEGPLPDPKSQIGTLADLKTGMGLMAGRRETEAEAAFRRVLAVNPKMVDAWEFLGRSLQKQRRYDEALAAYREALRISEGSPHIALAAASLYFDLGKLDDAASHAKLAMVAHPSFAHGLLAQIALRRKDLDGAEREARQAIQGEDALRVGPLITLAEVLHARGRYEEALDATAKAGQAFDQREEKDPDLIRGLHLVRGKILADLGNAAAAETELRREIELFPQDVRAYSNLAILYALTGRPQGTADTLRTLVGTNPTPAAYAEAVKTLRLLKDPNGASALLRYALGRYPQSPELRELGAG